VPPNKEKLKLVYRSKKVLDFIDVVEEKNIIGQIKPFHAGETLRWQVEGIVK
jgi:dihydroorotase